MDMWDGNKKNQNERGKENEGQQLLGNWFKI